MVGGSPLQEGDWKALKQYIKEEQATTRTLNSTDSKTWPVAHVISNMGHGILFLPIKLQQAVHQTTDQKGPRNTTIRAMGGYAQIWNGFMGLPQDMDI